MSAEVNRTEFDAFKSSVCHRLKFLGDIAFIIQILENDEIRMYYERKWYLECLYLLAMLDYLSMVSEVPLCSRYSDLRGFKLKGTVYLSSVIAVATVSEDAEQVKFQARSKSIPEFIRYNIVEVDVRDAT